MNKSESIKNLSIALSKFQGEVKNPPNSASNPYFKSKYAPLDVVINTAKPALAKNGLSYIQFPGCDGEFVTCTTRLMFEDEFIESAEMRIKPAKMDVQTMGATITYLRRYQLSALLGLASEEDKDGGKPENKAKKTEEEIEQEKAEKLAKDKIDSTKFNTIKAMLKATNTSEAQFAEYCGLKDIKDMTNKYFAKAMELLTKKKESQSQDKQNDEECPI